jgi:short-subunit dehydrogenase
MILIIGKSDLAQALTTVLDDTVVVGRPDYDFTNKDDCDRLVNTYTPDVIINTVGCINTDTWTALTTNYVGVAYLTLEFYERLSKAHIINISSTATYWVSYPNIPTDRFVYNLSKEALSEFGKHMNRKICDDNKNIIVTTIEPGKFNSKFNNYSGGMPITKVANMIKNVIDNPVTHLSVIK